MVRVKVCGITSSEDAALAVAAGAHALGFIFCESPRRVSSEVARRISATVPPFVGRVGVFGGQDGESIAATAAMCALDTVQLVGYPDVPSAELFRKRALRVVLAVRVKDKSSIDALLEYDADAYLLDSYKAGILGGTGEAFDWSLVEYAKTRTHRPVILAGGLNPENIAEAVRATDPYAVDVCSGVEAEPGRKDPAKLSSFFSQLYDERWRSA